MIRERKRSRHEQHAPCSQLAICLDSYVDDVHIYNLCIYVAPQQCRSPCKMTCSGAD